MTDFNYGDYVYLNEIDEKSKRYHQLFIHNEEPQMTIMKPKKLFKKSLI